MTIKDELRSKANSLCSAVLKDAELTPSQKEEILNMLSNLYRQLTDEYFNAEISQKYLAKIQSTYREIKLSRKTAGCTT